MQLARIALTPEKRPTNKGFEKFGVARQLSNKVLVKVTTGTTGVGGGTVRCIAR